MARWMAPAACSNTSGSVAKLTCMYMCMACARAVHGMCTACTWPVHGLCTAWAWPMHGVCRAHLNPQQRALADAMPSVVGDEEVLAVAEEHERPLLRVRRRLHQPIGSSWPLQPSRPRCRHLGFGSGLG